MGVYAHRFIEALGKDNKWQVVPLWSKYKEDSYSHPIGEGGVLLCVVFSSYLNNFVCLKSVP